MPVTLQRAPWRGFLSGALALPLLLAACSDGDGADGTAVAPTPVIGTATPEATPTPEPAPDRRWPALGAARVTTEDLNVRIGPGLEYVVLGRLQPDDEVPVAGRASDGRWLAIPGVGWAAYDETWVALSVPWTELPTIALAESGFEFVGPLYPVDGGADIPVVDQVVETVVRGERGALLRLAQGTSDQGTSDQGGERQDGEEQDEQDQDGGGGQGAQQGRPSGSPPNSACPADVLPASELSERVDDFLASPSGASGPLRLYAVIGTPGAAASGSQEGVDPTFSIVFAFEGGEGRQVWLGPEGRIAWFSLGCDAFTPGELLRLDPGRDHFFWLRPIAPEPLDPVQ